MTRSSPRRAEMEARLGELIAGRFRLQRVVGAGGMGWVFLAIQEPLGRPVAIKVLAKQLREDAFRQRFFREAKVAASLSSPHIVTVHDYGETEDGELFIAMEFVEGVPLNLVLKRESPLEPERVCRLARQVCAGLGVAHDAGVVHRDLKPSNLMLKSNRAGEEVVKILDFGLVKSFSEDAPDGELTGANAVLGSPNYMAPEQIRRRHIDQRTDIYALGAIIYRMLTGHLPFEAETVVETMSMHLKEAAPPVDRHLPDPDFSARQLGGIALRCLEKAPEQRYGSMDEIIEALDGVERLMQPGPLAPPRRSSSSIDLTPSSGASFTGATPVSVSLTSDLVLEDKEATHAAASSTPAPLAPPEAAPSSRRGLGLGLAAVALVAAGALLTVLLPAAAPTPSSPPSAAAPPHPEKLAPAAPEPPKVAPTTPEPAEVASPRPEKVALEITSEPAGAEVRLGARALGTTPLQVELPRAEAPVKLTFARTGYRATAREVALDGSVEQLSVRLAKKRRRRKVTPEPEAEPPPKVSNPLRDKLKANPYD